ncbi:DUF3383 family protein [Agrobacterium tumefaciens]|uniref:DUF3383 family protein n=1 Tax=Agrobacterium tumefaciens TaxID=358 RepID=UPI0015736E94|nr:DUF3383 domain-containing protein [Agrobacterium tumefaciens]
MAVLPYSRVVNVTLSRQDAFPSRRGFGTILILQSVAKAGKVDATNRTKLYATLDEVAADFATTDDAYKAAAEAFSQNPRPISIKIAYYDATTATSAALLIAQLDLIYAYDSDFYLITVETALRDQAKLDGLVSWTQAKNKIALIDSNAAGMQNPADTANIAARFKGTVDRTGVFYHTDAAEYPAIALAAYMSTRNFDDAESAYTAKFKYLSSVAPINVGSAAVTAVTGFTPGIGQSVTAGHCANTYINIGGRNLVVEGSTLTPNVFLDEIHATDWIIARTEEETLGILLNNARVKFDDSGMQQIASAARMVMQQASRAGIIAQDLNENGEYEAAVEITVPSVFSVPASQRKARIAPAISVRFRYAGALHYVTINYTMTF